MGMIQEFKEFAVKGNVVDMAVGIIIGAAFGKIVSTLVDGVIMPPIGMLMGGIDFSDLFINLGEGSFQTLAAAEEAGAPVIKIGSFINEIIAFTIVAFAVFLLVKGINNLKRKEEEKPEKPAEPSEDILLLREIRDQLKK